MPTPTTDAEEAKKPRARRTSSASTASRNGHGAYVMPIVHITVPEAAVNVGFWAALGGAAVLGAVELPLAALIGAGVLVARHHSSD
jgi:hypothetical protein